MTTKSNRVDNFHEGQVWESPRGTIYKVKSSQRGGDAILSVDFGGGGRKITRKWDAVMNWGLIFDPKFDKE